MVLVTVNLVKGLFYINKIKDEDQKIRILFAIGKSEEALQILEKSNNWNLEIESNCQKYVYKTGYLNQMSICLKILTNTFY